MTAAVARTLQLDRDNLSKKTTTKNKTISKLHKRNNNVYRAVHNQAKYNRNHHKYNGGGFLKPEYSQFAPRYRNLNCAGENMFHPGCN